jgi:hypothetical protein
MSGTAGAAYRAEIEALQNYQKEILNTLDGLTVGSTALTAVNAVAAMFGSGANNGLGTFPEAVSLNDTYNSVMQSMITNFKEITDLVNAMANVLGKSASSYSDTEAQLTAQFNKIVTQYETQSGSFTPTGTSTTTGTTTQTGTGGTSSTTGSTTGSTTSSTTTTASDTTSTTTSGGGTTSYATPTSGSGTTSSDANDGA